MLRTTRLNLASAGVIGLVNGDVFIYRVWSLRLCMSIYIMSSREIIFE
jgi:hypothetical protein